MTDARTDFAHVGPRAAGARAQLLLALLLAAVAPFFVIGRPIETHAVKLDLWPTPENPSPTAPPAVGVFRLSSLSFPDELLDSPPLRRIELTADGRILADGAETDLIGLQRRLDMLAIRTEVPWVEFRPDASARYEMFVEVFAVFKRAAYYRVHIDNSRFRRAIDEHGEARRVAL